MIPGVYAVLGFLLLVTGRKLYWLFVGVVGFVLGVYLASITFTAESDIVLIVIALIGGIISMILAFYAQRLAIAIAGFFAGGLILQNISIMVSNFNLGMPDWLLFLLGGIVGIVLILVLFDWALVILSASLGAYLLVALFKMDSFMSLIAFTFLFLVGVFVQSRSLHST